MSESNTEINYKEAYEREHEKCADLADKIVCTGIGEGRSAVQTGPNQEK